MKKTFFVLTFILTSLNFSFSYNSQILSNGLYKVFFNEKDQDRENINKKNIVKHFCDQINLNDTYEGEFNISDSLFLRILCIETNIFPDFHYEGKIELKKNSLKDYEKLLENAKEDKNKGIYKKCKITGGYITDPDSLNNVDFVCVANSIFNELMNDYLNIATYFAYGGFRGKEVLKKWESDFFIKKGGICDDSYLNSSDNNKKWCKHNETYRYFQGLVSGLNNGIKNLYFINTDPSRVYDDFKGINGDGTQKYLLTIKDKIYTELYFYSIFLEFYASMIELESSGLQLKSDSYEGVKNMERVSQKEANNARRSITLARFSISRSFKVLKDIYWTLPLHIGYMTVKEDIKKLMDALATIYTPIDQLRYKLKNVQDKDKK